ncbi:MAG: LCP family protein [Nocardioidaceae bacterium]
MSAVASPRTARRAGSGTASGPPDVLFRRALVLLLMTLVLPGSAQLAAGSTRWGRVALRIVGGLLLVALLLALVGWAWPGALASLVFNPGVLAVLRVGLVGCALGWVVLFVDAWRIGDPLALRRRQRLAMFSLTSLLCVLVCGTLVFGSYLVSVHRTLLMDMFGAGAVSATEDGRYNVLLLGADAGRSREGLRPDSITLASIDQDSGRTVLFSLPRNLENVPFPEGTRMHREFPTGFDCKDCYLNSVYTWATGHPDLFPAEVDDVGAYATKQAVEATTGLTVNYYAMVDLRGFRELVDAVGGVSMTVPERIPIGSPGGQVRGWIKAGRQHLNGYQTLWFARSRATSDDYARMARQKCVLDAMLTQLSPRRVLTHFQQIADAGTRAVTTDVPASELGTFLRLASLAKQRPVASVSFVPPRVETWDPDFDTIHSMVERAVRKAERAVRKAERADERTGPGRVRAAAHRDPSDTKATAGHPPANQSDDVSRACG